jgi:segregation and condensation protein B
MEMLQSGDYKKLIEAALFVSGKALSADEISQAIGVASVGAVNTMVTELMKEYESRDTSMSILKIGDKYIMSVKEPYAGRVSGLAGAPDMSKGALRILAFVSKNEPVLQSSVVKAFGSSAYDYLRELREKDFITRTKSGRSMKLQTTLKFKEYFNF